MSATDLNVHIINLAIDHGYEMRGEDLLVTLRDSEVATHWAAINARNT